MDLMDGIPAGLLSQCGPDDIMTAGRAVLLREERPVDTVRHGQNLKFFTLESENLLKKHSFRGYLMYDLKARRRQ